MSISGKAMVAGVIGFPVAHSLSPALHGYWIRQHGLDAAYIPLAIAPDDFSRVFPLLPNMGLRGVNVTLPHKEAAFALVHHKDAAALATGAVNTVVWKDGVAHGSNTDVFGFIQSLAGVDLANLAGRPAVVLGAGGAARAVVHALLSLGVQRVHVVNRTLSRGIVLANFFGTGVEAHPWQELGALGTGCGVLVNTTSLGMTGQPQLEVDLSCLPADAVVCDIVYRPLDTALLRAARARGLKTADGLDMLIHQARPGFKSWFGVDPEVTPGLRTEMVSLLNR